MMRNFLLIALLLLPISAFADTIAGRVVAVTDGDTVKVLDAAHTLWKVRLMGIDAPENKMPFGDKSKQHLSALIFNRQVEVEYIHKDRYGRIVGKILVGGVDANLSQVKAGMAWHYKQYQREQTKEDRAAYTLAEEMARNESLGIWSVSDPMPPWEWRHQGKK